MPKQNTVELVLAIRDEATGTLRQVEGQFSASMRGMQGASGAIDDIAGKFSRLLGPAAIGGLVVQASRMGIEWEQTLFSMRKTFQGEADAMIAKAAELSRQTGSYFSQAEISGALVRTADSMKRYGLSSDQYMTMISRAIDLAAAKSVELANVVPRLESGIRGEAEASEYLGLTLNDTYMKNMAFGGSLRDTWEKLNDNEKAMYRFNELMNQSSKYMGAAAEASQSFGGAIQGWWNWFKDDFSKGMANANRTLGELIKKMNEHKGLQAAGAAGVQALGAAHGDYGDDPLGVSAMVEAQNKATEKSRFKLSEWQTNLEQAMKQIQALEVERSNLLSGYTRSRENNERKITEALSEQARLEKLLTQLARERMDAQNEAGANAVDAAIRAAQDQLARARTDEFVAQQERLARIQSELSEKAAKGQLSTSDAQKEITSLLKDRSKWEGSINDLLDRRAQLERQMAATDDDAEMLALRDAIYEIDNALAPMNDLLRQTESILNEVERTRTAVIDADIGRAQDKVLALLDQVNAVGEASREIRMEIYTSDTMARLQEVYAMLARINQMAFMTYQINILGAMSPARPFSETYRDLIGKLGSIPGGTQYQIDFLMKRGGMDASGATAVLQQYGALNKLQAQLREAEESLEYYKRNIYIGYAQPSGIPMANYYEYTVIPTLLNKIQEQQLNLYGTFAQQMGRGAPQAAATSGASRSGGGGGGGGGVTISVNTINVNAPAAGSARDFAIGAAAAIDAELAGLVKSNRSQLRQALGG